MDILQFGTDSKLKKVWLKLVKNFELCIINSQV